MENKWNDILELSIKLGISVTGPFPEKGIKISTPGWETYRTTQDQTLETLQWLDQGGQIEVIFLNRESVGQL